MANLYAVTLTPVQDDDSDEAGLPQVIAFTAHCNGAADKYWTLSSGEAATVLAHLFSPKDVSQIEAHLCSCESVTLPTIYGPTELVQMGYRIRLDAVN